MFARFIAAGARFTFLGHEVIQAGDLAVHFTPWRMTGTDPEGKPITGAGLSVAVLRQQPDGKWLMVIDDPYGDSVMSLASNLDVPRRHELPARRQEAIEAFTRAHCGVVSEAAACQCNRRVPIALRVRLFRVGIPRTRGAPVSPPSSFRLATSHASFAQCPSAQGLP